MSEEQIISFLEFVNQDDEDKYNMLVESAAIIRQKENIIKEVREYVDKWLDGKINDDIIIAMNRIGNILEKEK